MAINAYTGIPGSGKSYQVVAEVILPAILAGRRVVTNLAGLHYDRIIHYLENKNPSADSSKFGQLVPVTNSDIEKNNFFCYEVEDSSGKRYADDTMVKPGDLTIIDECFKFWPPGSKIPSNHLQYFREHRHYIEPVSGVASDLVLITQDISDLHRSLKSVIEMTILTHKPKALGLTRTYTCHLYQGSKTRGKPFRTDIKRFNPEIFPLYSSYSGGDGKEKAVDKRQNIWRDPKFLMAIILAPLSLIVLWWLLFHYILSPDKYGKKSAVSASGASVASSVPLAAFSSSSFSPAELPESKFTARGFIETLNDDGSKTIRYLMSMEGKSPRIIYNRGAFFVDGTYIEGKIDGKNVSIYTGGAEGDERRNAGGALR